MVQEFNSADTNKNKGELKQHLAEQVEQVEAVNRQPQELLRSRRQVPMQQEVYAHIVKNMQFGLNVWRLEDPNDITSFRLVATKLAGFWIKASQDLILMVVLLGTLVLVLISVITMRLSTTHAPMVMLRFR